MDGAHVALSKTVAHALRHEPWLDELEPDAEGRVPVDDLLAAVRQTHGAAIRPPVGRRGHRRSRSEGRKAAAPVVLRVHAAGATAGVAFSRGNDHVWLADEVPARFLEPEADDRPATLPGSCAWAPTKLRRTSMTC